MRITVWTRMLAFVIALSLLAGCSSAATTQPAASAAPTAAASAAPSAAASAAPTAAPTAYTTVRMAITPFFEYQPWRIAHDLGLDHQQGIDLQFTTVSSGPGAATLTAQGTVDVFPNCHSGDFPLVKAIPDLRDWMITNLYNGFVVIGRKGKAVTYADLLNTESPTQALHDAIVQVKGKTFTMREVAYVDSLKAMLAQIGLTTNDVKITNFADDATAALAYIKGVGDYYFGGMVEELKMLQEYPDQFVSVGGSEILGAANWFSTMVSTGKWLDSNQQTAYKLLAIWYRTMQYVNQKPAVVYPLWAKYLNAQAASTFTADQMQYITTHLETYYTIQSAAQLPYNASSPEYWKIAALAYAKSDNASTNLDVSQYIVEETFYREFMLQTDLVDWVNSPLT